MMPSRVIREFGTRPLRIHKILRIAALLSLNTACSVAAIFSVDD
jgi:hypothetical protein